MFYKKFVHVAVSPQNGQQTFFDLSMSHFLVNGPTSLGPNPKI